jgi:hypothetical protein
LQKKQQQQQQRQQSMMKATQSKDKSSLEAQQHPIVIMYAAYEWYTTVAAILHSNYSAHHRCTAH